MKTFQIILQFGGSVWILFLLLMLTGPFHSFSLAMAIQLKRWWPGWYRFYTTSTKVACAAIIIGTLPNPKFQGGAVAYPALLLVALFVFICWYHGRAPQPHLILDIPCSSVSYDKRLALCQAITDYASRALDCVIFRESERSDGRLMLVTDKPRFILQPPYGFVIECPREECSGTIRVHCMFLDMAAGPDVAIAHSRNRARYDCLLEYLKETGVQVDLTATEPAAIIG